MNSIKYIFSFILILALLVSCQEYENTEEEDNISSVNLRIENATDIKLDSIISNNHYFGTLESGEISNYIEFDQIYQWPNVSCNDNERGYIWDSPIDNIGFWNSVYKEGNYTLVITSVAVNSPVLVEAHIKED